VSGGVSGLLVDGHDPQTWADALASVVLDPGRRDSMAQAASLHAAQFSWDVTVDGLLGSYARALLESREAASPPVLGAVAR
jgi:D-inositol-3-phosphate glycosyltransferase